MPTINYAGFSREKMLKGGKPLGLYGVMGDGYLQQSVQRALVEMILPADERDFNLETLDGDGLTVSALLAAAGNLPFLADHRVVVVQRAERVEGMQRTGDDTKEKGKASPAKRLAEGLEKLPVTTVVLLLRTPETPEPGSRAVAPRCVHATVDKVIDKNGMVVNCTIGPKDAGLAVAIVNQQAVDLGIPLQRGGAEKLVSRTGHDMANTINELQKCALRVGWGNAVTPAVIEEMTRRTPQETIFDLTDALGARRGPHAIGCLRELLEEGQAPEMILTMLVRQLRQLLQARTVLDTKLPLDASLGSRMPADLAAQLPQEGRDSLVNLLQAQSWMGRRLAQQARNFRVPQIEAALGQALAVDLAIKGIEGEGGEPELLLELMVTSLC